MRKLAKTGIIAIAILGCCVLAWDAAIDVGGWTPLIAPFVLLSVPAWIAVRFLRDSRIRRLLRNFCIAMLCSASALWILASTHWLGISLKGWGSLSVSHGALSYSWSPPQSWEKSGLTYFLYPMGFSGGPIFPYKVGRLLYKPSTFQLLFPLWIVVVTFLMPSMILIFRCPRYAIGQCQRCGYDLTGNVSGVCPECGIGITTQVGGPK